MRLFRSEDGCGLDCGFGVVEWERRRCFWHWGLGRLGALGIGVLRGRAR